MPRRFLWVGLAALILVSPARAQQPAKAPESLLAKECLAYARFDGVTAHQTGFDKTVLAELLRGETGEFLTQLGMLIQDSFGPDTVKQKLLAGFPPDQLMKIHAASNRLPQAITYLKEQGVVLGFEYVSLLPPAAQLTIIFPNGSQTGNREAIYAAFQLIAALNDFKIEESQLSGRAISQAKISEMAQWRWWQEGAHVVTTIGNANPEHTFSVVEGKRANLTTNPLFQSTAKGVAYETLFRGFIDAEASLRLTKLLGKGAEKAFADLGLMGLKSIMLHLGGAGKQTRTSLIINTTGERKGLLKLLTAQPKFAVDPLPPLPPDAANVTVLQIDLGDFYDTLRQLATATTPAPEKDGKHAFQKLDEALGIDVRKDLIGVLGSKVIVYSSGGEGFMGMGIGLAVQVKEAKKLKESLDVLQASLPSALESNIRFSSREVAGVTMHTIHGGGAGGARLSLSPSYAVTDDWLYFGIFPQSVAGALHRRTGKLSMWKPDPVVKEVLAEAEKNPQTRILAVTQSDPRPVLRDLASIGPFFFEQLGAFSDVKIDAGSIPNYQVITEPLFPNVGLIVDDGNAIRFETYSSIGIPFDPFGLHSYWFGVIIIGTF